jgi:GTP-binding protein
MQVKNAVFVISNTDYKKCPPPEKPEFAFIGRSNVGKSSLINMLTNRKKLAKTSARPGKTQLINHFLINEEWYLVDLPGYGWAKVSKSLKEQWEPMIKNYLVHRENLYCVFVLIDSRLPPQQNDIDFINGLGEADVPFVLVFTKADKQSKNKTQSNVAGFIKKMKENWDEIPRYFITSSEDDTGKEEVLAFIEELTEKK